MGTRHLICVVKNEEYKVAQYGQWDGYPEGQGVGVLNFLRDEMDRQVFEPKIADLTFITQEELSKLWQDAGANPNDEFVSMDIADKFNKAHPEFSRNTGLDILGMIQSSEKPLKLNNNIDFAADSLFCEFAYVIDLDKDTFEVYEGFNHDVLSETDRFYFMSGKRDEKSSYYPVKLVKSFNLAALPTDEEFLNSFKDEE